MTSLYFNILFILDVLTLTYIVKTNDTTPKKISGTSVEDEYKKYFLNDHAGVFEEEPEIVEIEEPTEKRMVEETEVSNEEF